VLEVPCKTLLGTSFPPACARHGARASSDGEPVGDTKKSGAAPAERLGLTARVSGAALGATESCSAQDARSRRNAAARGTTPGPERDSICPASEGIGGVRAAQLPDPRLDVRWSARAGARTQFRTGARLAVPRESSDEPAALAPQPCQPVPCARQTAARRPRGPRTSGERSPRPRHRLGREAAASVPSFRRQASILVGAALRRW